MEILPPSGLSDHGLIKFTFVCEFTLNQLAIQPRPNFFKADYTNMRSFFERQPFHPLTDFESVEDHWSYLCSLFNEAIRLYVPFTTPCTPKLRSIRSRTLKLIKQKYRLWKDYRC